MASTKVSLKLLIDTTSKKVLFAEAGKDFVDFLFNLLALPVGTVIRLLTKSSMVGSLGNLYGSIEEFSDAYLESAYTKDSLLRPKASASAAQVLLLPADNSCYVDKSSKLYTCSSDGIQVFRRVRQSYSPRETSKCSAYNVTTVANTVCPTCKENMATEMTYVGGQTEKEAKSSNQSGFVKEVVTYMVMDDLVVKPLSTISSIAMLTKFNIKDVGALEEKVVDLDMDLGLKLLKASLHSKTVLTSVFL